ncbi:lysoplasmalogenase [Vibrio sinensis]|uniref:Lysoplasmalogenase n=1 Tax=Vibrio sinensis TaxID=2302434 RepID=A0A3A6Q5E1_9VIBR|nr:lysoplasmalogenase [Vibrio sinensis]RJX65275.1 lysoplasmalogenase [Vibrio sinensis]
MWSWLCVVLAGFISISANEHDYKKQAAIFSSFSLLLLIVIIWTQEALVGVSAWWVSIGLLVSMLADSLYIFKKYAKYAFAGFITAQICYGASFWVRLSGEIVWWLPALLLAVCIITFFLLLPKIDRLLFPVVSMGIVLMWLSWSAGEVWLAQQSLASLLGFIGALVMMLSAGMLAIHDYRHPLRLGRYIVTGSYLLAHMLIVASLLV